MITRFIVVDDHPLLRQGLRQVLTSQPDLSLIGEASNGAAALQLANESNPDLVIMDIHLPDLSGLEVSREILKNHPNTKIIIFSADENRVLVDKALQIGVCGYLLKAGVAEEMARAIRRVMEGRLYLCPELASEVLGDYRRILVAKTHSRPLLTDREKRVLQLLAEGLQNKEIADRLSVSTKSVEKSRARLMSKLGYRSVAELTRYAVREGMVPD